MSLPTWRDHIWIFRTKIGVGSKMLGRFWNSSPQGTLFPKHYSIFSAKTNGLLRRRKSLISGLSRHWIEYLIAFTNSVTQRYLHFNTFSTFLYLKFWNWWHGTALLRERKIFSLQNELDLRSWKYPFVPSPYDFTINKLKKAQGGGHFITNVYTIFSRVERPPRLVRFPK